MPFLLNARENLLKNMVGALSCGKSCPYLAIPEAIPSLFSVLLFKKKSFVKVICICLTKLYFFIYMNMFLYISICIGEEGHSSYFFGT